MPIFPILIAMYPLLFLYSYNIHHLLFKEVLTPLLLAGGGAFLLYLLLSRLLQERAKGALIVSLFSFMFFTYGHVYNYLGTFGSTIGHHFLYPVWSLLLITGSYRIARTERDLARTIPFFNLTASLLILFTLVNMGLYTRNTRSTLQEIAALDYGSLPVVQEETPDIYYLVPDAYANHSILEKVYGYDNASFRHFLAEKGFYLAEEAHSNYALTFLSLASSLNMDYMHSLLEGQNHHPRDQMVPYHFIENNRVLHLLSQAGYQIIHFNSGWSGTIYNENAHHNVHCGHWENEFRLRAAGTTMLQPFITGSAARERVLCTFQELGRLDQFTQQPRFVFAHIIPPHPPYLFDSQGRPVEDTPLFLGGNIWKYRDRYLEQLQYINTLLTELIETLLSREEKPIIILQSDHGPASYYQWHQPGEEFIAERMGILNAYYVPEKEAQDLFYDSITPVNTFRVLFNHYFHTSFPLLEDTVYFSNYQHPYQLQDVTSICWPSREP